MAEVYNLPRRLWAIELAKSLTGSSLLAYETLSGEAWLDFEEVGNAVKRQFGVTIRTSHKTFLQAKCMENESQKDYAARLRKYYLEWLDKDEYDRTNEGYKKNYTHGLTCPSCLIIFHCEQLSISSKR